MSDPSASKRTLWPSNQIPHIFKGSLTERWFLCTKWKTHDSENNQFRALNQIDIHDQIETIIEQEVAKRLASLPTQPWVSISNASPAPGQLVVGLWPGLGTPRKFTSISLCIKSNDIDPHAYHSYNLNGMSDGNRLVFPPHYWAPIESLALPDHIRAIINQETETVPRMLASFPPHVPLIEDDNEGHGED